MKILVINAGSSSLKFKLYKMLDESVICAGLLQNIGKDTSAIGFKYLDEVYEKRVEIKDHEHAFKLLFDLLFEKGVLLELSELYGVGHRVVHGGDRFVKAQKVDEALLQALKNFIPLAPLHNPSNIQGMQAVKQQAASLRQVAVFDTAFHHTLPQYAARYALPTELYEKDKIRRYGFHGTSHEYVLKEMSRHLNKSVSETTIISLHLGNGASACAIKAGESVDTSMGMTPLEGLVMGSRSGDIDPSIIFYLHQQKGHSLEQIEIMLNQESGLFGICKENDMRLILAQAKEGNAYALALDIYVYRIKKYIGAYLAILGKVDGIVFTGGIGENSSEIREMILQGLEGLGIQMDREKNKNTKKEEVFFHLEGAQIKLAAIATNEELAIALATKAVLEEEIDG